MNAHIDASWKEASRLSLEYNYTNRRLSREPATVFLAQDPSGLDVAFVIRQRAPIIASTRSNGPAVYGDDNVQVSLNPQGVEGFSYQFISNALGTRYESSSENSAYSPQWTAHGRITKTGYVVTMHIPFSILRTGGSHTWKAQFSRFLVHTNSTFVWSYDSDAASPTDPIFSGTLRNMMAAKSTKSKSARPKARFQPYILGVGRSAAGGGSTSQVGLDMAIPITPTASFVGSFHPDYSNVETDQQTISPTAFPRQYQEVRPFFTQVGSAFNYSVGCINCPQLLYTPAIPTLRQGYGVEGTQGPLTFAGFDAVGTQRTDIASAVDYARTTSRNVIAINAQRVSVNAPGFTDNATSLNGGFGSERGHWYIYGNYAREDGTAVTISPQARYGELGTYYRTSNTTFAVARQFVGAQFSPIDGYVQQGDIGGYAASGAHTFHFSPKSRLQDIQIYANDARFWNHLSQAAQTSAGYAAVVDFKDQWSLQFYQQSTFVLTSNNEYLPFAVGNGGFLGYNLNSNYGVGLGYSEGAYYHGQAENWKFFDTIPLRRQISLSLALNENVYDSMRHGEPSFRQWLNTASVNWQFSRDASISVGARRINGVNLPNSISPPDFTPIFADNLSAAFHLLHGHNEFYLVYGDPNSLITTPAVYFKWIFYAGAEKGA